MELLLIAGVVALLFWLLRQRGATDAGALAGPVGWARGTDWHVVRPLARADSQRLLRHPAFIAGVIVTPLIILAATDSEHSWWKISGGIALGLVPLGWLTIVAANLATLRPRRTGADELFSTLPAPQPVRTTAGLTAGIGPVVVATILAAAAVVAIALTRDALRGSPRWTEIAAGLLIVAGSVCVGVAVARWLPSAGFGVLAAIATMLLQARFLDVSTWPWNRDESDPARFLGFLAEPTAVRDPFLELRPAGWHLLYLAGLVVVMAGVALAREGMRRPVAIVLAVGVVATVTAGWVQTRPPSQGREDEMVAYLTDPMAHQVCRTMASVRYCAYPDYRADLPDWRARVEATLARFPAAALAGRPRLDVVQRPAIVASNEDCAPTAFDTSLPSGVAVRVSPSALWPADGGVHPPFEEESFPCSERDVHGFFLAVQTGAWAVGLPPAPSGRDRRCASGGQARAVIALWAGAAATPDGARTLRDVANEADAAGKTRITFAEWDDPPMWGTEYTVADARAALALLKVAAAQVRAELDRDWAHWIAPSTPSTALTGALGTAGGDEVGAPAGTRCP